MNGIGKINGLYQDLFSFTNLFFKIGFGTYSMVFSRKSSLHPSFIIFSSIPIAFANSEEFPAPNLRTFILLALISLLSLISFCLNLSSAHAIYTSNIFLTIPQASHLFFHLLSLRINDFEDVSSLKRKRIIFSFFFNVVF